MPVTRGERSARALFAAYCISTQPRTVTIREGDDARPGTPAPRRTTAVARVVVFLGAIAAVLADGPKQHARVLAQDLPIMVRTTLLAVLIACTFAARRSLRLEVKWTRPARVGTD